MYIYICIHTVSYSTPYMVTVQTLSSMMKTRGAPKRSVFFEKTKNKLPKFRPVNAGPASQSLQPPCKPLILRLGHRRDPLEDGRSIKSMVKEPFGHRWHNSWYLSWFFCAINLWTNTRWRFKPKFSCTSWDYRIFEAGDSCFDLPSLDFSVFLPLLWL